MPQGSGPFGIGFEGVAQLSTWVRPLQTTKVACKNLEKAFIYWLDEEQGGRLSMRVANHLAASIRRGILDGSAFIAGTPPLSKKWVSRKQKLGLYTDMGRATGQMAEEFRAIPAGKGMYRVGISPRTKRRQMHAVNQETGRRVKIGSYETVYEVAAALEFGSRDGKQPPRPFMMPAFINFVHNELPRTISSTILKDMEPQMQIIAQNMAKSGKWEIPSPEAFYTIHTEGRRPTPVTRTRKMSRAERGSPSAPRNIQIDPSSSFVQVSDHEQMEKLPGTWTDSVNGLTYRFQRGVLEYLDTLGRWRRATR